MPGWRSPSGSAPASTPRCSTRGLRSARHLLAAAGLARLSLQARRSPSYAMSRRAVVRRGQRRRLARGGRRGAGAAWLAGIVALGAATYFAALWLLGFRLVRFREARLTCALLPSMRFAAALCAALVRGPVPRRGRPAVVGRRAHSGARVERYRRPQPSARGLPRPGGAGQFLGDLVRAVPRGDAVDGAAEEDPRGPPFVVLAVNVDEPESRVA